MKKRTIVILAICLSILTPSQRGIVQGQTPEEVTCNSSFGGVFSEKFQENIYVIEMPSLSSFTISIQPAGTTLKTLIVLYDPSGMRLADSDPAPTSKNFGNAPVTELPYIESGVLSATGKYKIRIANTSISRPYDGLISLDSVSGGVGDYKLDIDCQLLDPIPEEDAEPTTQAVPPELPDPAQGSSFLEVGSTYDVTLYSGIETITVLEIMEDGWVEVLIGNRVGWLNLNQVALVLPASE